MVRFHADSTLANAAALRAARGAHLIFFEEGDAAANLKIRAPWLSWSNDAGDPAIPYAEFADFTLRYGRRDVNGASGEYTASALFSALKKHDLVASFPAGSMMLMPRFVALLEQKLRTAARRGYSARELLDIDKAVIDAIIERHSEVKVDGNLAIEYVSDQRTGLFEPDSRELRQPASDRRGGGSHCPVDGFYRRDARAARSAAPERVVRHDHRAR